MQYRKEVDGLRAVAVVPVVLFHAGFEWVQGGFTGVDVFFVISGYLITSLIVLEKRDKTFFIVEFYERRARRILPPLFAMIAVCLIPAFFLMMPTQLKNFGQGIAAVSLFVSNILFFLQSGYFAPDAGENPLLHTWTLAVEEQYYVLFPILVALLWRFGKRKIFGAVIAIAAASFAFAHLGGSFNSHFPFIDRDWTFLASSFAFYLTPARAWELMVGALVALTFPGGTVRYSLASEVMAALGIVLILAAFITFSDQTPSPSFYTLVPTLGTALVLLFATPQTIVGKTLSTGPFVGIGLISYSIYLWHQPIFAFARLYATATPSAWVFAALALSTVPIGYLSWRYIERPFRDRKKFTRAQIFGMAAVMSAAFVSLGFLVVSTNGFVGRYPEADRALLMSDPEEIGRYVSARFNDMDQEFDTRSAKSKLLVVGDSFGKDFVNMVGENHLLQNYQLRTFYIPFACQIVVPAPDTAFCRKQSVLNPIVQRRVRMANVIVLASDWLPNTATQLKTAVHALALRPDQKLIILGTKRLSPLRLLTYLKLPLAQRLTLRVRVERRKANDIIQQAFPDKFVDFFGRICPHDLCPVFAPNGKIISFDGSHLTPDGARYAGKILFENQILKGLQHNQ
jgi:peptidoglycan/LPS O-acetylase OafA/YrhL